MGALIEINTDGLAKFGETICNATGLSAYGYKKMANVKIYERIENSKVDTAIEIEKLNREDIVAKYNEIRNKHKFENTASIIQKAEQQFNEGEQASSEPVDKDWLNRFLDYAEGVSEEEMQNIWAKILAGEVKQPKSFSLRTLNVLRNMTKEDAELFVEVSKYVFGGQNILNEKSIIQLESILKLNDNGLVLLESLSYIVKLPSQGKISLKLTGDKQLYIDSNESVDKKVYISIYALSKAGEELYKIVETNISSEVIQFIANKIKSEGNYVVNYVVKLNVSDLENK